jgi:transcriptional regulator with XRE-family HTH domain
MNSSKRDPDIGQRLRQLRQRLGLSQRELARRAGLSNATISMIESNQVSPSVSALKQVLSAIDVGIADFFASAETETGRIVFRADELTEIADGAVSYKQVGANLSGRSLQMVHERYRAGAQSGKHMCRIRARRRASSSRDASALKSKAGAMSWDRATLIFSTAASRTPLEILARAISFWSRPAPRQASDLKRDSSAMSHSGTSPGSAR